MNKRERFILFLPAILMLVANMIVIMPLDHSARAALMDPDRIKEVMESGDASGLMLAFWIVAILLVFSQIVFAIVKVSKIMLSEAELMREYPSHLAYLEWRWILGISFSVLIFLVINALIEMIVPMNYMGMVVVYNLLMLLAGGVTGYLGMKQDTLLNQVEKIIVVPEQPETDTVDDSLETKKETVSSRFITAKEAEELHKLIIDYLDSEKPYIQPDFSMHELCDKLNVSRRKISYVLNEIIQKNFYGVINEYRIREAEVLLMQDNLNQMKIEVLGEMVGFQSKSSFNACFKKVTGMTPSEYRAKKKVS